MDIKTMSINDLIRLQSRLKSVLSRKQAALVKARARVERIAKAAGVSAKELTERKAAAPKWQRRAKKPAHVVVTEGAIVAAAGKRKLVLMERKAKTKRTTTKYKHPNGEHSWSGFGPRPAWMKAALKSGIKLDALRVN